MQSMGYELFVILEATFRADVSALIDMSAAQTTDGLMLLLRQVSQLS